MMTNDAEIALAEHSENSITVQIERPVEPQIGIPFVALRERQCKFPLGHTNELPTRFCGDSTPIGSPYCFAHRQLAYRPVPRR